MRLLVSVRSKEEAQAAHAGGADNNDAKEPSRGALGAVEIGVLRDIVNEVNGIRPVSAALGDSEDSDWLAASARAAAEAGATCGKVGFADVRDPAEVRSRRACGMEAASFATAPCAVVAVAYADWD